MSDGTHPGKQLHAVPSAAQLHQRRQQLQRALSGLQYALDTLPLTREQRSVLKSIIKVQGTRLAATPKVAHVPQPKPSKKSPKERLSPEEQARRTKDGQAKQQARAELERVARMAEDKRRAQIKEVHRKSGYTDYQRRVPGSFEGGTK